MYLFIREPGLPSLRHPQPPRYPDRGRGMVGPLGRPVVTTRTGRCRRDVTGRFVYLYRRQSKTESLEHVRQRKTISLPLIRPFP